MPAYRYIALTASGERRQGVLDGPSRQAVLADLDRQRLTPVSINEDHGRAAQRRMSGGRRVSGAQLATAYQQLADLLRAGVPLLRAIKLIGGRKSSPSVAGVFTDLAKAVEDGQDLARAMEAHALTFKPIHIAMVRAGEKGGFLEPALARLSALVTGQVELRQKIVGSLVYPAVASSLGLVLVLAVFLVYVPQFKGVFEGIELPLLTRIVFGLSDVILGFWPVLLGLLVGVPIVLVGLLRQPAIRRRIIERLQRLPIVWPILRTLAVARFCRVLGTLLQNGVTMLSAMGIARDAAGLRPLQEAVDGATEAVRAGRSLAGPLAESGLFPDDVLEIISVGESANNLDVVLLSAAETLEKRLDRRLTAAVRLIEPAMIVLLALSIAVIAAALILPMLRLTSDAGVQ